MKRKLWLLIFCGVMCIGFHFDTMGVSAQSAVETKRFSLNGLWFFHYAKSALDGDKLKSFSSFDFNVRKAHFDEITVPSCWAVLGYEEPVYRGFKSEEVSEGFYIKEFEEPEGFDKKRVLLHFGGVWQSAEVWLNGIYLGIHESGYTSFAFDVTNKLKRGQNRLAVRVRQVSRGYKYDVFDDWTLGGIYRDVELEAMPRSRWIDRVTATVDFDADYKDADVTVNVLVNDLQKTTLPGNYPSPGEPYRLRISMSDMNGIEVGYRLLSLPAHVATGRESSITLHLSAPHGWTAETPYLYSLRVELLEGDSISHCREERIGLREVSTKGGVFRINGQAVKLRGVNRHDEHPDVGRAVSEKVWREDLLLMKAANINYVRAAHYQHAEGFLRLCDELGMYVGEEVSLGGAGELMYDPSCIGATLQRVHETVMRDLNRACIVYWSVGNEDALTPQHLDALRTVKGLDKTRPVLIPWRAEEWLPEDIDILAPHYWKPQEYDKIAASSDRPIISTEYTHAYGLHGEGGLESRWKALTQHPSGAGAAIWMWADQGLKTPIKKSKKDLSPEDEYLRIAGEGWDGIVDSYRRVTRDYEEAKAVYQPVYPSVDELSFRPGEKTLRVPIRNDYDFTNLSSVSIEWRIWSSKVTEPKAELMAEGCDSLYGNPHTTTDFELPLAIFKNECFMKDKTYYVWFVFKNAKGNEIGRDAVELIPNTVFEEKKEVYTEVCKEMKDGLLQIKAGQVRYSFNVAKGHLVEMAKNDTVLLRELQPALWRRLDPCETSAIGRKNIAVAADLNRYKTEVREWNVKELSDGIEISVVVGYKVDEKNSYTGQYKYYVDKTGELSVTYSYLTDVTISQLPSAGMAFNLSASLTDLSWFGLGPMDAYFNKKAAPILGRWGGKLGSTDVIGTKMTRSILLTGGVFGVVCIESEGFMEQEGMMLRILSNVYGRPEKGRKADDSVPQLLTNTDVPFVGSFRVRVR